MRIENLERVLIHSQQKIKELEQRSRYEMVGIYTLISISILIILTFGYIRVFSLF